MEPKIIYARQEGMVSALLSGGEMKKLADMNLAYDFLAYSLTAHKRYGEEASRFILECI